MTTHFSWLEGTIEAIEKDGYSGQDDPDADREATQTSTTGSSGSDSEADSTITSYDPTEELANQVGLSDGATGSEILTAGGDPYAGATTATGSDGTADMGTVRNIVTDVLNQQQDAAETAQREAENAVESASSSSSLFVPAALVLGGVYAVKKVFL